MSSQRLGGSGMNGQIQRAARVRAPSKIKINVVAVRSGLLARSHARSRIAHALSAPRGPSADVVGVQCHLSFPSLSLSFFLPLSFALYLSLFLSVSLTYAITHRRTLRYVQARTFTRSLPPPSRPTSPYISNPALSLSPPPLIPSDHHHLFVSLYSSRASSFFITISVSLARIPRLNQSVGQNRPRDRERERGLNYLPPTERRSLPTTIITTTITRPVFTPISRQHHRASSRFTRGPSLRV